MLNLRQSIEPTQASPYLNQPGQGFYDTYAATDIDGSSGLRRGFISAGAGINASDMMTEAAQAYSRGDTLRGQFLETQARDEAARAQRWAPRVQQLEDVNNLSDAGTYVAGHLASGLRSSIPSFAGSLAGGAVGAGIGALTRNAALGSRVGAALGGFSQGYDMMRDEAVMGAMTDDKARRTRSYDDILNAGSVQGVVGGALEAVAPGMIAGRMINGAGKSVLRNVGQELVTEGLTEASQDVTGQMTQNYLRQDPLSNIDGGQVLNAGVAGAIGGGGMTAAGAAVGKAREMASAGAGKVVDKFKNPHVISDTIADAGAKIGDAVGDFEARQSTPTDAELAEMVKRHFDGPSRRDHNFMSVPSNEAGLSPAEKIANAEGRARKLAEHMLKNPGEYTEAEREAAAEMVAGGRYEDFDAKLSASRKNSALENIAESLNSLKPKESKIGAGAKLTEQGEIAAKLSDLWLRTDGQKFDTFIGGDKAAKNAAAGLMEWVRSGFGAEYNDGQTFVPQDLIENLGDNGYEIITSMANMARKQGLIDNNGVLAATKIADQLKADITNKKGAYNFIDSMLTPLANDNWSEKKSKNVIDLLSKAKGDVGDAVKSALRESFGENTDKVISYFKEKPTKPTETIDNEIGLTRRAKDSDELEYENQQAAQQEMRTSGSKKFIPRSVKNGSYYDLKDPDQKALLAERSKKYRQPNTADDAVQRDITHVGKVDHILATLAEEKGVDVSALPHNTRMAKIREIVHEHFPALQRVGNAPKGVGKLAMSDYKKRKVEYDRRVEGLAKKINAEYKIIHLEEREAARDGIDFSEKTVKSLGLDRDMRDPYANKSVKGLGIRDPKNHPRTGTIVLKTKSGKDFVTTTQMLMAHMFGVKDGSSDQQVEPNGTAHTALTKVSDALVSLFNADDRFTGEIGVVRQKGNDAFIEYGKDLPDDLRLYKNKKTGREYSVGDAKKAAAQKSSETHTFDFDPDEAVQRRNKTVTQVVQTDNGPRRHTTEFVGTKKSDSKPETGQVGTDTLADYDPKGGIKREEATGLSNMGSQFLDGMNMVGRSTSAGKDQTSVIPEVRDEHTVKAPNIPLEGKAEPGPATKSVGEKLSKDDGGDVAYGHENAHLLDSVKSDYSDVRALNSVIGAADIGKKSEVDQVQQSVASMPFVNMVVRNGLVSQFAVSGQLNEALARVMPVNENGSTRLVVVLSDRALNGGDRAKNINMILSHEIGHVIENFVDLTEFMPTGEIAKLARAVPEGNDIYKALNNPLRQLLEGNTFHQELHAQLFSLFINPKSNTELKAVSPTLHARMEGMYGVQGTHVGAFGGRDSGLGRSGVGGGDTEGRRDKLVKGRDGAVGGENGRSQPTGSGVAQKLSTQKVNLFIKQFSTLSPVSEKHKAAIDDALALLKGEKQGDVIAALDKVFAASRYLSDYKSQGIDDFASEIEEMNNFDPSEDLDNFERDYDAALLSHQVDEHRFENPEGIGEEAAVTPAEHLQALLDANPGASAFWRSVAKSAVDSKNEGKINGAIAAAKKQGLTTGKNSKQAAKAAEKITPEQEQQIIDMIKSIVGDDIRIAFIDAFKNGISGTWTKSKKVNLDNLIKIARNADVMSTSFHESFHQLTDMLRTYGGEQVVKHLENVAMSGIMQRRLKQALSDHPEAISQLSDPEEAAAYMFQFWMMNPSGFPIGEQTKGFFNSIKKFLMKAAGIFSESIRKLNQERAKQDLEALTTEQIMSAFKSGAMAKFDTRGAVVQALNKKVENHEAAVKHLNDGWVNLVNSVGKLVMSAEAVMDATGNKYATEAVRMFHQKAGTAMRTFKNGAVGGFSDGVRHETAKFLNDLENTVLMKHDEVDLELARKALSTGSKPTDAKALAAYNDMRAYFDKMAAYMAQRDVRRLNSERVGDSGKRGVWEKVELRKDYWPQVFSVDYIMAHHDELRADLLKHHKDELEAIARDANAELGEGHVAAGTAAGAELSRALKESNESGNLNVTFREVTAEDVADALVKRLLNSHGQIDINEDTSDLGITPFAAAVNRRSLNWLDMTHFDKYMEKDVGSVMTIYTRNMVKRGEYQSRFGYGGEKLRDTMDKAVLAELGGDELIERAEARLTAAQRAWKSENGTPYPTLRSVGQKLAKDAFLAKQIAAGKSQADAEAAFNAELLKAVSKLEPAMKAVQAMEGTLGRDVAPSIRSLNSWLVTYQNFRLLSTMIFTSFQDVMGIVREGGEMGDAWKAFVTGIREIKNTYAKKKTLDDTMMRGEEWGAVDAGAYLDTVGQAVGSVFMSGKARELSDKFFKYTGAEGWNRGIRAVAAEVAERTIIGWTKQKGEMDPATKARFERLYGEGAKITDVKLDANGRLDIADPRNVAAVNRWALDAIPAPTAAHRPVWSSDPNFSAFMHLKNFTYAFHRVALKGAVEQAKLGNYRPALVTALGYMPIAIAAGAIKEMLIPGDEPPWMKGGMDGYLSYGWDRAGVLGVPQMYADALFDADPAKLFGPTVDQLQNVLSVPLPDMKLDLPMLGKTGLDDHTLIGETLGALPGGNLARRLEELTK